MKLYAQSVLGCTTCYHALPCRAVHAHDSMSVLLVKEVTTIMLNAARLVFIAEDTAMNGQIAPFVGYVSMYQNDNLTDSVMGQKAKR